LIETYVRCLAVLLAAMQSYGIALGLEGAGNIVADPGYFFRLSTVVTFTGGVVFLMWLCHQITLRGIANGISLVLLTNIVVEIPATLAGALELSRVGVMSGNDLMLVAAVVIAVAVIVWVGERARRRISIAFPGRPNGGRAVESVSTDLSLKLNSAGMMPLAIGYLLLSELVLSVLAVLFVIVGQEAPVWLGNFVA